MSSPARLAIIEDGSAVTVAVSGRWISRDGIPSLSGVSRALLGAPERVSVEDRGLERWDSSLLVAVRRIEDACAARGLVLQTTGLPRAAREQLDLVRAAPPPPGARKMGARELVDALARLRRASPLADRIGVAVLESLEFLGRASSGLGRALTGRTLRLDLDLGPAIQEAGVGVLPVLALIAVLGGGVLSLLAAQQLDQLGVDPARGLAVVPGAGRVRADARLGLDAPRRRRAVRRDGPLDGDFPRGGHQLGRVRLQPLR